MANQLPGIDVRNQNNVLLLEIILYRLLRLFARIVNIVVFAHQPRDLDMTRFHFLMRNAIVADVRVRSHHDLPEVRWIGKYFLVPRQAYIKANFARGGAYLARRLAMIYSPFSLQLIVQQLGEVGDHYNKKLNG